MSTIKQIASLAGVSRGTVDRVLNNRGGVSAATEAKIKQIITLLDYTPSIAGKNLAIIKKNLKFGYIMFGSTNSNPFFNDVVFGIKAKAKELEEFGVNVDIRYSQFDNYENQVELLENLFVSGIHGIVITPVNHLSVAQKIKELSNAGIPIITVNTDIKDSGRIAYVGSDYFKSGKTAGALIGLITNGQANVGIVSGSDSVLCHTERIAGFERKVAKYYPGIRIIDKVINHDDDFESFSKTKTMLANHLEIDTLFLVAAGIEGACRAAMETGRKLKIISFDCVPVTRKLILEDIISATIDQQPFYQGSKPLDLLFDLIAMGISPQQEYYFTNIEIKIKDNL